MLEMNVTKNNDQNMFVDPRDNKSYRMVTIGDKTWLAEDFAYVCVGSRKGGDCTFYEAEALRRVAPKGWHVSTQEDWKNLISYAEENGISSPELCLMSKDWSDKKVTPTDDFGFCAKSHVNDSAYFWEKDNQKNNVKCINAYGIKNVDASKYPESAYIAVRLVKDEVVPVVERTEFVTPTIDGSFGDGVDAKGDGVV